LSSADTKPANQRQTHASGSSGGGDDGTGGGGDDDASVTAAALRQQQVVTERTFPVRSSGGTRRVTRQGGWVQSERG